jgi:hypothetical protein
MRDESFKAIPFSSACEGELLMLDFKIEAVKMLYAILKKVMSKA